MNEHRLSPDAFRGSMTALVTPFRDGAVDWKCLSALLDQQIEAGTDWLVPCGTTGESPTLTEEEGDRILEHVIRRAGENAPVMAGTGSNDTRKAIQWTKRAAELGADAALIVAPYYNRPTQEGLFRHYAAIAESVSLPIVLYNVPARTGVSIGNDVVVRLRERFPHVVALKHATGSLDGAAELRNRCDITILSGEDQLTLPLMDLGATGVISVLSNLDPHLMRALVHAALTGDRDLALRCHARVTNLAEGLAAFGPNPLPIKTAMAFRGLLREEFRLPLCPLDSAARRGIEKLMEQHSPMETVPA